MSEKSIPQEVKEQVSKIIEGFNKDVLGNSAIYYRSRFKGRFVYLERSVFGRLGAICRLEYTGSMDGWKFAIYRYSRNRYDPNEWMFTGAEEVNGTVEGAMKAGLKAYPP